MNIVFFGLVAIAFSVTAGRQIFWIPTTDKVASPMQQLGVGMIDSAGSSVTLALGLVGVMALFLGLMKVVDATPTDKDFEVLKHLGMAIRAAL